jgi:hypothetical protein
VNNPLRFADSDGMQVKEIEDCTKDQASLLEAAVECACQRMKQFLDKTPAAQAAQVNGHLAAANHAPATASEMDQMRNILKKAYERCKLNEIEIDCECCDNKNRRAYVKDFGIFGMSDTINVCVNNPFWKDGGKTASEIKGFGQTYGGNLNQYMTSPCLSIYHELTHMGGSSDESDDWASNAHDLTFVAR